MSFISFADYQEMAAHKARVFDDPDEAIEWYVTGLLDAGESLSQITIEHTKPFGTRELGAIAGNVLFYLALAIDFYGLSLSDIAEESIP